MDAVLLALGSAALFGAMTVTLRLALLRNADARLGAAVTALVALVVALAATPATSGATGPRDLALFAAAGLLALGLSQLFFTLAVRDAGSARASVVVGAAPLITVALGIGLLDEPFSVALLAGAALIVAGGAALAWERLRPATFRAIGMAWAVGCTVLFACRDTFIRWFSGETPVASTDAAAATLLGGSVVLTSSAPS
jgi:drug/metabolite transporter (DMT)-like permease